MAAAPASRRIPPVGIDCATRATNDEYSSAAYVPPEAALRRAVSSGRPVPADTSGARSAIEQPRLQVVVLLPVRCLAAGAG